LSSKHQKVRLSLYALSQFLRSPLNFQNIILPFIKVIFRLLILSEQVFQNFQIKISETSEKYFRKDLRILRTILPEYVRCLLEQVFQNISHEIYFENNFPKHIKYVSAFWTSFIFTFSIFFLFNVLNFFFVCSNGNDESMDSNDRGNVMQYNAEGSFRLFLWLLGAFSNLEVLEAMVKKKTKTKTISDQRIDYSQQV